MHIQLNTTKPASRDTPEISPTSAFTHSASFDCVRWFPLRRKMRRKRQASPRSRSISTVDWGSLMGRETKGDVTKQPGWGRHLEWHLVSKADETQTSGHAQNFERYEPLPCGWQKQWERYIYTLCSHTPNSSERVFASTLCHSKELDHSLAPADNICV